MNAMLSVGIDIGTTTTQLVFSRLTVRNEAAAFQVPHYAISEKEVLYRSAIHFTPLISDTVIDAEGVRRIVDREYAAAGVRKEEIQTGAVIITGETARKENAREVLTALSGYAGDFVVATAGPALESVLAGKGAGSQTVSQERQCAVLNLDIGGGTTNLALFDRGRLHGTGCLNVGGRLMKFDAEERLTYCSPVLAPFFSFPLGQRLSEAALEPVTALLVEILEEAAGLREIQDPERFRHFITDQALPLEEPPLLSFSGGVADLIDGQERPPFLYGDLGVLLGRAISQSRLCAGRYLRARETIRATVIGAGSHTTELSGSTIFYQNISFPLKNLPVAELSAEECRLPPEALAERIRARREIFCQDGAPTALSLEGWQNPKFSELCRLADGIAMAQDPARPLIVAVTADMGKALGHALAALLPGTPLVCLDSIQLTEGSYLDIAAPIAAGQVLPVVVKTLAL